MNNKSYVKTCGWSSSIEGFLTEDTPAILSELNAFVKNPGIQQQTAWKNSISCLQKRLSELERVVHEYSLCSIILEYEIPRESRRVDAIVIVKGGIIVLEFKDKANYTQADKDQVLAYARDLRSYHAACDGVEVRPVLILTKANATYDQSGRLSIISGDNLGKL